MNPWLIYGLGVASPFVVALLGWIIRDIPEAYRIWRRELRESTPAKKSRVHLRRGLGWLRRDGPDAPGKQLPDSGANEPPEPGVYLDVVEEWQSGQEPFDG